MLHINLSGHCLSRKHDGVLVCPPLEAVYCVAAFLSPRLRSQFPGRAALSVIQLPNEMPLPRPQLQLLVYFCLLAPPFFSAPRRAANRFCVMGVGPLLQRAGYAGTCDVMYLPCSLVVGAGFRKLPEIPATICWSGCCKSRRDFRKLSS